MKKVLLGALISSALIAPNLVHAQASYPSKPVTIVVGFAAGGPTDIVARTLAQAMEKSLGTTVVVENKAGVGGVIGVGDIAKAQPDGYRVLVHHIGMATAPSLYRKLAFDVTKDFEYIGLINEVPMVMLTKPGMPVNNLKELNAYVAANKNKISFANAGLGSASHLCGLLYMSSIKVDLTTVPYKGTAPAMTDLIGGQVDMLCDQTTSVTAQVKGGKVKPIAITSPARLDTLKEIPTTAEGGSAGFQVSVWHGLYAPKGTPKPVLDKLVASLQAALADPALRKRFDDLGAQTVSKERATPAALESHLKAEIAKWTPIIKAAGEYAD
jgi:tripartite-type tricarboxylate transporter receptor subunit TctC